MTEELSYVMQYLTAEGFVIRSPQDYFIFTNKFYNEFTGSDIGAVPVADIQLVKTQNAVITMAGTKSPVTANPKEGYLTFITECGIPKRAQTSSGEVYSLNQYSEKGAKAFAKILKRVAQGEIDLNILIKATQLYYKSPGYKLKVGNFIGEGSWETDYNAMQTSIEDQTLTKHIKDALDNDNNGTSRYQSTGKSNPAGPQSDPRRTLRKEPGNKLLTQTN